MASAKAEWTMVGLTVVSVVFVGIPIWLLRKTLDDQFEANLQNRKIDACVEFLIAVSASKEGYDAWATTARGENTVLNLEENGAYLLQQAREQALAVNLPAKRLKFLAGEEAQEAISSLLSVKTTFLFLLGATPPSSKANDEEWFGQYDPAVEIIRGRCTLAIEGKATGRL